MHPEHVPWRDSACPFIIAELGVNHDGSPQRALALVDLAHRAGADAIKLQHFRADQLLSRAARLAVYQQRAGAADPFELLRGLELTVKQMRPVVDRAHTMGLRAIVTIFSVEVVGDAADLPWDAVKVASPDIINQPLIEALRALGRPMILSTGAATADEVQRAIAWLGDHPHALLHCVSAYPTPDEHAALGGIGALKRLAPGVVVGYSDHTTSVETGARAVAAGARILEKHLTHDRAAAGPDHAASLDGDAFAEYVRRARAARPAAAAMIEPKIVLPIERDVRTVSRQSLTTTASLAAGHVLSRADLTIKRPGTGLPPFELQRVIGRRLARPVEADMPLTAEDVD